MHPIRFLDAGEAALVIELGDTVDPELSERVLALDAAFAAAALPGVLELVPTYRSLMVHYDPLLVERARLVELALRADLAPAGAAVRRAHWTIPCCYDPEFGEDVARIGQEKGLEPGAVVALHAGATYRVYMYGFAPGFCYLGGLPAELAVSRRVTPRPPHPPNTVLVGGGLSLISTFSMPTGWWLFGRTPERMFSPQREPAFLVGVGDTLRFEPIDRPTFAALEARAATGEIVAGREAAR